jgi:hypothetical protein
MARDERQQQLLLVSQFIRTGVNIQSTTPDYSSLRPTRTAGPFETVQETDLRENSHIIHHHVTFIPCDPSIEPSEYSGLVPFQFFNCTNHGHQEARRVNLQWARLRWSTPGRQGIWWAKSIRRIHHRATTGAKVSTR